MVKFECPNVKNTCVSFTFEWFPFPILPFSLWGNKELDLPAWKVKKLNFFRKKSAKQTANGPIRMPQGQGPLCLIHFSYPFFLNLRHRPSAPLFAVCVPTPLERSPLLTATWEAEGKVEIFLNKMSLAGSKRSSLNGPRSETPVSHVLLKNSPFQFPAPASSSLPLSSLGVIRNGLLWESG